MTGGWLVLWLVVALALASVSVRVLVGLPAAQRGGRLLVLALSALLGVLLAALVADWSWWPAGVVVGLGVVEVGPAVAGAVRALVRRKGGDV